MRGFKINFDVNNCGNYDLTQSCDAGNLTTPTGRFIQCKDLIL